MLDVHEEPKRTLLVALGNLEILDQIPGGLEKFVRDGGAVLLASDRGTTSPDAKAAIKQVAGVSISGDKLSCPDLQFCYRQQLPFCPILQSPPGSPPVHLLNFDGEPKGGRLTIKLANITFTAVDALRPPRKAGDFVRLTVGDTGHGMSPETLSRLFEPYFSTKDASRGPGLGLSITSATVAEHGGWLEVESREGRGTTFHLHLPRSNEPESAPRETPVADPKSMEGRERILVVDDEELVRMVTKAVLAYRGYEIVEAEDGEDAVAKYRQAATPFDLVLMDLHMPRLNGRDALLRIRESHPGAKFVLLSGGLQEEAAEGAASLEGVAFLHKPFDNQELVRLVRQMLDQ